MTSKKFLIIRKVEYMKVIFGRLAFCILILMFFASQVFCAEVMEPLLPADYSVRTHHVSAEELERWESSPYFDTAMLRNPREMNVFLRGQGFRPVRFQSLDGLWLDGLLLQREDATHTAVVCTGFFPGRKEGMATFTEIFGPKANVLLFDARGHGKSEGKFIRTLRSYGQREFLDILGALEYVTWRFGSLPIILFGICSGAFHCAHALLRLEEMRKRFPGKFDHCDVRGLVFDSGWNSVGTAGLAAVPAEVRKILLRGVQRCCCVRGKREALRSKSYRFASWCSDTFLKGLYHCAFKRPYDMADEATRLDNKINLVPCPMLVIHDRGDTYSPFKDLKTLISKLPHGSRTAFPEGCSHACIHLQQKEWYAEYVRDFVLDVLTAARAA
jgi:pimeloyl-ACP methyl ester carboxylesterase